MQGIHQGTRNWYNGEHRFTFHITERTSQFYNDAKWLCNVRNEIRKSHWRIF